MQYLQLIWADGRPSAEDIATMNQEIPAFDAEMTRRGVRLLGRELDFPNTAATVRRHDGEMLVTDGPFAETKEFIAGFDLLECADLDEAIEVTAQNPISRFHPMELRPLVDEPQLGEAVWAFGRGEDGDRRPLLLSAWSARPLADPAVTAQVATWREDLQAKGLHVFGSGLGGADRATTLRVRDSEVVLSEGSFSRLESASPASRSSPARTARRRPNSPPRTRSRNTTRSRCAPSTSDRPDPGQAQAGQADEW